MLSGSLSDGPAVALCLLLWYQIMTCDAAVVASAYEGDYFIINQLRDSNWQEDIFLDHNLARGHDECACSSSNIFEDITEQACTYSMNALPEAWGILFAGKSGEQTLHIFVTKRKGSPS